MTNKLHSTIRERILAALAVAPDGAFLPVAQLQTAGLPPGADLPVAPQAITAYLQAVLTGRIPTEKGYDVGIFSFRRGDQKHDTLGVRKRLGHRLFGD